MMLAAERLGFRRFVGHVLDENLPMRKLLKNIGEIVSTRVSGSVHELLYSPQRNVDPWSLIPDP
jgi:hypothetical protein